jgi:hypothetical protein
MKRLLTAIAAAFVLVWPHVARAEDTKLTIMVFDDMEGFKNVLKLRAQFEGGTPNPPVDFSYYQKALAGR